MRKFIFGVILAAASAAVTFAADVSVKAVVNDNRGFVGTGFAYTITVNGAQDVPAPVLPALDGLDVRYVGPATRVSVINNAYSIEQSFNYSIVPLKEGRFVIPSVTVDVKGQILQTEPIPVDILPSGAKPAVSDAGGAPVKEDIEGRLKLLMGTPRERVYIGEAVPLTVRLYVNQLALQDLSFPQITADGFQIDPFTEPRQFQETLQGVNWQVVEFSTFLFPSRAGEVVVPSVLVRGSLLFKASQSRDPSGGFFDEGFLSSFFTSYQKRAVTVKSLPLKLDVLPLPEEGKPVDLSGGVGEFDLSVDVAPLKVKAGDPVTVRMMLSGAGNMKAVRMPVLEGAGFKSYDPQIRDEPGRKILEQVLIPVDVNCRQIPAIRFSYFDPKAGVYRAIERGPFVLEVAPPVSGEEFQAVGFSQPVAVTSPEQIGRDIIFIKDDPGMFKRHSGHMARHALFYIALVVFVQVWAAFLAFYVYRRRLLKDPHFARQRGAAREVYKVFDQAKEHINAGAVKAFYDVLENGLNDYFVLRLELPPGRAEFSSLEVSLKTLKVDEKLIAALEDIYAIAERARFAGSAVTQTDMRTHLADAEDIVRAVERRAK